MSHTNITKVMWYIFVQLSSLNNTMSPEGREARRPESLDDFTLSSLRASQPYSFLSYLLDWVFK
jgi:hypothetical protein